MLAQICKTCKNKDKKCYCAPNSTCSDYEEEIKAKHTVFDKLKSMNINELAEWLNEYGELDGSPWMSWFSKLYCNNCTVIMCKYEDGKKEFPCSYCELNDKCKFFPNLDDIPDDKMIIKMWLESEVKE